MQVGEQVELGGDGTALLNRSRLRGWCGLLRYFGYPKFTQHGVELQIAVELSKLLFVGHADDELLRLKGYGRIGADSDQVARELNLLTLALDLGAQGTFDLIGVREQVIDRAELLQQFDGGLLPHSGTTRDVVGGIAHERQQVDDLTLVAQSVLLADLFRSHLFKPSGVLGAVHVHTFGDELAVVLVRRSHQHLKALLFRQGSYRADDIVRLKTRTLQACDMHGVEQVFDDGHGTAYILGRLFALRLVGGIRLMTERRAGRIKRHGNVRRVGLLKQIIQGDCKAENSGCILATRIDTGRTDKGVVRTVDHRIGVNEQQFHRVGVL